MMRSKSHGSSPSRRYAFDLAERREGNGLAMYSQFCIETAYTKLGVQALTLGLASGFFEALCNDANEL